MTHNDAPKPEQTEAQRKGRLHKVRRGCLNNLLRLSTGAVPIDWGHLLRALGSTETDLADSDGAVQSVYKG